MEALICMLRLCIITVYSLEDVRHVQDKHKYGLSNTNSIMCLLSRFEAIFE